MITLLCPSWASWRFNKWVWILTTKHLNVYWFYRIQNEISHIFPNLCCSSAFLMRGFQSLNAVPLSTTRCGTSSFRFFFFFTHIIVHHTVLKTKCDVIFQRVPKILWYINSSETAIGQRVKGVVMAQSTGRGQPLRQYNARLSISPYHLDESW